jgi:hypothetical protein
VKMSTAMSMVDRVWRDNPDRAETTLGAPAITKLQAWQGLQGSFSAVELAERLNAADDPATVKAREAAKEGAEKEVKSLTASDMAYKLGTGWYCGALRQHQGRRARGRLQCHLYRAPDLWR